jgi:hypothetical protein
MNWVMLVVTPLVPLYCLLMVGAQGNWVFSQLLVPSS